MNHTLCLILRAVYGGVSWVMLQGTYYAASQIAVFSGYFNVKVMDSLYPSTELFHYDVGVDCPKHFTVTFEVPTEGKHTHEKRFLVSAELIQIFFFNFAKFTFTLTEFTKIIMQLNECICWKNGWLYGNNLSSTSLIINVL